MRKFHGTISLVSLLLSIAAIVISIIRPECISENAVIGALIAILSLLVAIALAFNIYTNLEASKSVAKEVAKKTAVETVSTEVFKVTKDLFDKYIADNNQRINNEIWASGNYAIGLSSLRMNNLDNALTSFKTARDQFELSGNKHMIEIVDVKIKALEQKHK